MSKRIKVTGYLEIDDDQFDPGSNGPLTEAAYLQFVAEDGGSSPKISSMEDVEFALADD